MEEDIFSVVRQKIIKACTDDPREFADNYHILWIPLKETITGYPASYSVIAAIGINERLTGTWLRFAAWHELGHVLDGHVYEQGRLLDNGFFTQEVDSRTIPRHENTANLISADVCVKDDDVLRVSNYNSETIKTYRRI